MHPRYPIPWKVLTGLVTAALTHRRRPFSVDARYAVGLLQTGALHLRGEENMPNAGPGLVTVNHYSRPGFDAWWLAFALSAHVPVEIHWILTAGWTYPDRFRKNLITPLTTWAFRRVAEIYGFSTMPPMPPDPKDVASRASAVKQVLTYLRNAPNPLIGFAPEGQDFDSGRLGSPPGGAGRFMLHIAKLGLPIQPVGIYERQGGLYVHFGERYQLSAPPGLTPGALDQYVIDCVMTRIAALLPADLHGAYSVRSEE